MIDDIFKRVDALPRDRVPDALVLTQTQTLTMGDVRELVKLVRDQQRQINDAERAEVIRTAALIHAQRAAQPDPTEHTKELALDVEDARELIAEADRQLSKP